MPSWPRGADRVEAIPDPTADEALRSAAGTVKGLLLVGTINSISVRRDAAAVDLLAGHLKGQDADAASATAVALGHIGNDAATKTLRQSLASTAAPVRGAVAEGCVLLRRAWCADGKNKEAAEIYDAVRQADVPKPHKLEATRSVILARKSDGIPLLIEQIKSPDKAMMQIAFMTARELPGTEVTNALAAEVGPASPDRAAAVVVCLGRSA